MKKNPPPILVKCPYCAEGPFQKRGIKGHIRWTHPGEDVPAYESLEVADKGELFEPAVAGDEKPAADGSAEVPVAKRPVASPGSAKRGFWDFMDDMPSLFGHGEAVDRVLADPAKLVKDSAAAIKTMKTVVGFAALGVALLPLLPYFKEQLANIKAAKAAAGTSPASATSAQTEKVVGLPLGAGKDPFITEIVKTGNG